MVESILLVDGDAETRDSMNFILELNGYRVVEAHHGIDALQILDEWGTNIQLALCGPDLPDITGPEWLSQLRFLGPEVRWVRNPVTPAKGSRSAMERA